MRQDPFEITRKKLPQIFVDSIIVDLNFHIQIVSQNVLDIVEFTMEELHGKHLLYITGAKEPICGLESEIRSGYFDNVPFQVYSKTKNCITLLLEGFQTSICSNLPGFYVLKIKNARDIFSGNRTEQKKTELDKFVYRVAHDIRGPLATMQGLINLLKVGDEETSVELLVGLLDKQAKKLDERLFQMVYLSKTGNHEDTPKNIIDFSFLERMLRVVLNQNSVDDYVRLNYTAPTKKLHGINELHLQTILVNLLLYFLSLPKATLEGSISYELVKMEDVLYVSVEAYGFKADERLQNVILHEEFFYTDIIHYSKLLHFYAARKTAQKLASNMKVDFASPSLQTVTFSIPLANN